ncbi:general substrate transporter [Desarmillaria tabescens]|uniref:General substrate transporter n=1 Tax=Armillaria tabescens TaxID=1929756 RepID=A0AA39N0Q9_ARMTA|nr:general substrate transporter [Desarmillaria tabescens]KAK0452930.1 general substrate transporter [Desarmillaria tabescens]
MWKVRSDRMPYFGLTGMALNAWVNVACITAMTLFGYDQGVFGGIIVTDDFLKQMGYPDSSLQGTIVSLYDTGCFIGAMSSFVIGERFERKKMLMFGVIVMSVGAIIQTSSYNVPTIIVSRIITGIGNGINTATAPVWQSETTKPSLRGKVVVLGMMYGITFISSCTHEHGITSLPSMNIAGYAISNWMTFGLSYVGGNISWRFPLAFQLVFSVIMLCTVPWLPESPRWLLAHGREAEGVLILIVLEGEHVKSTDTTIVTQKAEILEAVRIERETSPSLSDLLHGRTGETGMVKRMCLGAGTQWMQQLSGINVTSYYLPLVLQNSVGLSNRLSRLLAACNAISYLVFSFAGLHLIERAGRRKLLIWGAAGQAVCYIFISALLSQGGTNYGAAATAFFFVYYIFFGVCWQGVPWLYPVEINSLSMRTMGAALATGSNWISNYCVVQATPPGIQHLGWRFYLIWMTFNIVIIPVVYLFYPETSNRHLEDIDRLYREHKGMVFVFRNKEAIQMERPERYSLTDEERVSQVKKNLVDVGIINHLEHAENEEDT